jgi:hypothetical protein
MIMLPKATRVMSDRQPIALIVHDEVGTGGRMGNLPGLPPKGNKLPLNEGYLSTFYDTANCIYFKASRYFCFTSNVLPSLPFLLDESEFFVGVLHIISLLLIFLGLQSF